MLVIKRSGEPVSFNIAKIREAVGKAGASPEVAESVSRSVADFFNGMVHVEEIQDVVEKKLSELDFEASKRYILYRRSRQYDSGTDVLSDYIHYSKYSREGKSYADSVDLRMEVDLERFPFLEEPIREAYEWVRSKKILPSMRSMQFSGAAIRQHNARMYNCSFTLIDRLEAFSQGLYLLLCGCGVGYSVQKRHVTNLTPLKEVDQSSVVYHTVADSIEGWADALLALLHGHVHGRYVEFIYKKIRPKGSPLTHGGKAPGHVPLKRALEKIRSILVPGPWSSLQAHRVMCISAKAVLAGGIRRSSLMCLFDRWDQEMLSCKTGNWYETMPELAMSNNSAVFLRGSEDEEEFMALFEHMKEYGEPGFFFTDDYDWGTNPCAEIGLNPKLGDETGFAFCNLSEINAAQVPEEEFLDACAYVALINTLQASWTDFPYLGRVSEEIARRDALLGVGITGQAECRYDSELLRLGAARIRDVNKKVATEISINEARSLTCVKPSGTTSLLLGCVGSGVHPHPAKKYIRRVTANPLEPAFQFFKRYNPHMCREKPNGDWVIEFPVATDGEVMGDEITFMEEVFRVYENWVVPGTNAFPRHNVSCTVTVQNWNQIPEHVWFNRLRITAMSFLPKITGYDFMPIEPVESASQVAYWSELRGNRVPWEDYDGSVMDMGSACEGGKCEI